MDETEKIIENLNNTILDDSKTQEVDDYVADDVIQVTYVGPGNRPGSLSLHWRHDQKFFRGFARQRSKDKTIYSVFCFRNTSYVEKRCNFSFKVKCVYEKGSEKFYLPENWVIVKQNSVSKHNQVTDDAEILKESHENSMSHFPY